MSWKVYIIFITNPGNVQIDEAFVADLGLKGYVVKGETTFNFSPSQGQLYIGCYRGNLLIANSDLNFQFFKPKPTTVEKLFLQRFSHSEIAVLTMAYIYAYVIYKQGVKIRAKEGGDKVYQDYGELLPEEQMLLKQGLISQENLAEMHREMSEAEVQTALESELGGATALELTVRYLGERMDSPNINYKGIKGILFENKAAQGVTKYPEIETLQFIE